MGRLDGTALCLANVTPGTYGSTTDRALHAATSRALATTSAPLHRAPSHRATAARQEETPIFVHGAAAWMSPREEMSTSSCRARAWERHLPRYMREEHDPLFARSDVGSGPTIRTTIVVSKAAQDVALAQACQRGDLTEVRLALAAPGVTLDAMVRVSGRPTSAMHLAAESGAAVVVALLLEAGADPCSSPVGLRALRPLHVARNVPVARLLLVAKASPVSVDPREPDPTWYHRQRGRTRLALEIERAAEEARASSPYALGTVRSAAITSGGGGGGSGGGAARGGKGQVVPAVSGDELRAALVAWGVTWGALEAAGKAPGEVDDGAAECAVCMGSLAAPPASCAPPVEGDGGGNEAGGGGGGGGVGRCGSESLVWLPCGEACATPHLFHAACLAQWLHKKASCPVCRTDVRTLLPRQQSREPRGQGQGQGAGSGRGEHYHTGGGGGGGGGSGGRTERRLVTARGSPALMPPRPPESERGRVRPAIRSWM